MRKLSLALVFTAFAVVSCGGGSTHNGADKAEAGHGLDVSRLDIPPAGDAAGAVGGGAETGGSGTSTARDSAGADTLERRDLFPGADGATANPGADTLQGVDLARGMDGRSAADAATDSASSDVRSAGSDGAASKDVAADAPVTILPPGPCQGTCGAVCTGACVGKCLVTSADGTCASSCDGWCDGTCSGSCTPAGRPCTVQGVLVPDGQGCPSSDAFAHVCDKGTCKIVPPDGACPLPSGTNYAGRDFLVPGETCPTGGVCRGGMCCKGCWTGTKCVSGDTPEGCGAPGTLCQECPVGACFLGSGVVLSPGQACPSGGACRGGACCKGCWDGTQCLSGDAPPSCGTDGALCESCPTGSCFFPASTTPTGRNFVLSGDRCPTGGTCRAGSCCQGCWNGTECLAGNTLSACGTGGAACEQCAWLCSSFTGTAYNPCGGASGRTSIVAQQPSCAGTCTHAALTAATCCGFEDASAACGADVGCK